jgi:hypothetical protein
MELALGFQALLDSAQRRSFFQELLQGFRVLLVH